MTSKIMIRIIVNSITVIVSSSMLMYLACSTAGEGAEELYTARRGEFQSVVTVTGELAAVNSLVIYSPMLSWQVGLPKISQIVEDGKRVEKGELLAQFDPTEVQRTIQDAQNELEIAQAEKAKAEANYNSEMEGLKADLEVARLGNKISQLRLEQAAFEAEIDRKKIELDLEKSAIQLQKAEQEIQDKARVREQELSKLELRVEQAVTKLRQAEETLRSLSITAPTPGLALLRRNHATDEKFQINDQPYPGWPLIGLPDLDSMQAEVEINEVDIAKITISQAARIRLDAYPDTSFRGHVTSIGALARNKSRNSKVKVFDVIIRVDENDAKLMPGMTVSCDIIIDRFPDTLFVPSDAIFDKEGRSIVYVRNGGGFDERTIETGQESDNYVLIASGLKEGERVALTDPTLRAEQEKKSETPGRTEEK